jgi:hypothetical protein
VGVVVSGTAPNVVVEVPADRTDQIAVGGILLAGMTAGGWIGGLVHQPVLGGLVGLWAAQRIWNRRP